MHQTADPPERIRLPLNGRIIAWAFAGVFAVAAALFSIFYYALDSADADDPTAQGLIPEELVPEYLEEYVRTE